MSEYNLAADFLAVLQELGLDGEHVVAREPMELNDWEGADRPSVWVFQESKLINGELYRVWVDTAYGRIALTCGQPIKHIAHCKHSVNLGEAVALDKHYYGLSKYLWE